MGKAIALTLLGGIVVGVGYAATENLIVNGLIMGVGLALLVVGYSLWTGKEH